MHRLISIAALLLLVVPGGACAQAQAPSSPAAAAPALPPQAGARRALEHNGLTRTYSIVRPPGRSAPAPLVIFLHGGATSDGASTMRWGFAELAARDGVVTAHPDGMGEGWNDGRQSSYLTERQGGEVDDVGFILAMIDALAAEGLVDPTRVYVVGGSNGGMMALRLACEASTRFAAVAPFIANFPVGETERCAPQRAMPIVMINGDEDRLMPFAGGAVASVAQGDRGQVVSSDETFAWWRRFNGCGELQSAMLADRDANDGTRVREDAAPSCRDGAEVVRLVVQGGGHRLPALDAAEVAGRRGAIIGRASRDVDGADYIWSFFSRHGLNR